MRIVALLLLLILGVASPDPVRADQIRVLVMGDSLMTSNSSARASVPHHLARVPGLRVTSRAVTGARFAYALPITGALGMNIAKQWRGGAWDVVVMNGGGNDLLLGCACAACDKRLNRLISKDGTRGLIPSAVARARAGGAHVIFTGYMRSPGRGSPVESCRVWGDRLEARVSRMAARDPGVSFVSLADLVPPGSRRFHAADMIHPSPRGSAAIAERIARKLGLR